MNWLAHVHLSPPDVEFQLGNLLADMVRREPAGAVSASFDQGRRCHQVIDRFTDTHDIVRRSMSRISPAYRRYAGILVDMFYDHFLARRWEEFHAEPLRTFLDRFYAEAQGKAALLPEEGADAVEYIVRSDRLYSYLRTEGIHEALERMSLRLSRRWNRNLCLQDAMDDFPQFSHLLEKDFMEYFPLLQRHLRESGWSGGEAI